MHSSLSVSYSLMRPRVGVSVVTRSPPVGRLTCLHSELMKGEVPIIIRANRSLIRFIPSKNRLVEMPPPEDGADDDGLVTAAGLRLFGPTYATISAKGDGIDSQDPLPPIQPKRSAPTKASKRSQKSEKPKPAKPKPAKEKSSKHQKSSKRKVTKGKKISQHASDKSDNESERDSDFLSTSADEKESGYSTDSSGTNVGDEGLLSPFSLLGLSDFI
jgi:outer membrane biosynthesis protein TonB